LDRSELLARQAAYLNRNRVNPATAQGTDQSTANTGQVRGGGQVSTDVPSQGLIQKRHHRDGENNSQNATSGKPATGSRNGGIEVANSPVRGGKPVLNFNNANTMNFTDACRRHRDRHDRDWWRNHCHTIILIGSGFYAWDLGYWYPAYGYDSYYSNYAYDGPIYGYDGLPPDQIIANVQYALQQLGYFAEDVDGVLGPVTRQAIEDYQLDNGLNVTGSIDRPTLVALGFVY
jgi:Putative peptidoglycan binding domain